MNKVIIILLLSALTCTGLIAQSGKKSRVLKPSNYTRKVTTVINDKARSYYSLDTEKTSIITVQGPGRLRVLTRGRFGPNQSEKISYEIIYRINGGEWQKTEIKNVGKSKEASYKKTSLGTPGIGKDFEIELGRGYHNIELKLATKEFPVATRYLFTKTKAKKREWIAYSPLQPTEPINLISREDIYTYYRFTPEKPLKVEVNGPTQLRILTRVEYHYQMKGRIHYRLQVNEKGKVISTYQLSSRRSEVAAYETNKELIPGKAREFVINVPKGRHTYEVIPLDKDKDHLLGRILLPKKDVKIRD